MTYPFNNDLKAFLQPYENEQQGHGIYTIWYVFKYVIPETKWDQLQIDVNKWSVEFTYPREYKEYIEKYGLVVTRGTQSITFSVHSEMQRHCGEWAKLSDFEKILKAVYAISSNSLDVNYQLLNKKYFKTEFGKETEVENPRKRY